MTELVKIIGVGMLTLVAYIIIKPLKTELAIFVSIVGCVVILLMCVDGLMSIITTMTTFVEKTGINTGLLGYILKIVGVGYIIEFSSNICSTSGNSNIADVIVLAGKITILVMSLPILSSLINIIIDILP